MRQSERISIGAEIRVWIAGFLLIVAMAAVWFAIMLPFPVEPWLRTEQQLAAYMRRATESAGEFRQQHGALPNDGQMKAISKQVAIGDPPREFYIADPLNEAAAKLGPIPQNGFVVGYWRGEREEGYASWSGRSTIRTDEAEISRELVQAAFVFGSLGLLCGIAAFAIWPWAALRQRANK